VKLTKNQGTDEQNNEGITKEIKEASPKKPESKRNSSERKNSKQKASTNGKEEKYFERIGIIIKNISMKDCIFIIIKINKKWCFWNRCLFIFFKVQRSLMSRSARNPKRRRSP
jgi:hypothetical protein